MIVCMLKLSIAVEKDLNYTLFLFLTFAINFPSTDNFSPYIVENEAILDFTEVTVPVNILINLCEKLEPVYAILFRKF